MKKVAIAQIGTSRYSHGNSIFASLCKLLKYAKMVARAGKHLHMEKPGSPTVCERQNASRFPIACFLTKVYLGE